MNDFFTKITGYATQAAQVADSVGNVIRQPEQVRAQEQAQIAAANPPPPGNRNLLIIGLVAGLVLVAGLWVYLWKKA